MCREIATTQVACLGARDGRLRFPMLPLPERLVTVELDSNRFPARVALLCGLQ